MTPFASFGSLWTKRWARRGFEKNRRGVLISLHSSGLLPSVREESCCLRPRFNLVNRPTERRKVVCLRKEESVC